MGLPRALVDLTDSVRLRRHLNADGYDDAHIRTLVARGALYRVRRGAFVDRELWESLTAADRHRVLGRAVLLNAHPTTVLTHVSGAIEHGAAVWGVPLDTVHTTRMDAISGRRARDWVQHRGALPHDQVEHRNGVPVGVAARCAVEMTTIASLEPSLVTVNDLLHMGAMTQADFARLAHDSRYWPHSLVTGLVVRMCDGRLETAAETRTDFLCWAQHLPRPVPQVVIRDASGEAFARVDFAWPELGVFLEFDGKVKYARHRRQGETLEQYVMREKKREERICQVTGWVCIRIGWEDLTNPQATAARIRLLLESRSRHRA